MSISTASSPSASAPNTLAATPSKAASTVKNSSPSNSSPSGPSTYSTPSTIALLQQQQQHAQVFGGGLPSMPRFTPLAPLSTRILCLSGFPSTFKTRDIQAVFSPWEDDRGGFKIKWVDDTNALVVFNDPAIAKRAYLQTLMSPPPSLITASGLPVKLRPYDGEDAENIINSVQNRQRSRSHLTNANVNVPVSMSPSISSDGVVNSSANIERGSSPSNAFSSPKKPMSRLSGSPSASFGHRRNPSGSNSASLPAKPVAAALYDAAQGGPSPARHLANAAAAEREREMEKLSRFSVEEEDEEEEEQQESNPKQQESMAEALAT